MATTEDPPPYPSHKGRGVITTHTIKGSIKDKQLKI